MDQVQSQVDDALSALQDYLNTISEPSRVDKIRLEEEIKRNLHLQMENKALRTAYEVLMCNYNQTDASLRQTARQLAERTLELDHLTEKRSSALLEAAIKMNDDY